MKTRSKNKKQTSKNSRQSLLQKLSRTPKAVWIGLVILVFGAIGSKTLLFSEATAFHYVGTHPYASKQPENSTGRPIQSLEAWNGKIYAGYGDWNKNTGPVYLNPFDPTTNSFGASEHTADTEAIEVWKKIDNKIFGLHVDPKSHNGAAYSLGEIVNGNAVWKNISEPKLTHIFGITAISPNELFLAGQRDEGSPDNEVAKVFRSTDGGATWTESLSVPSRGGFNRMMFVAALGNSVYAQNLSTGDFNGNNPQAKAWVYNGKSWSKATPISQTYNPYNGMEFAGKILAQSSSYGGSLLAYDGRGTTTVRSNIRDYKVHSDGYVYVVAYNGGDLWVMRSNNLSSWESISIVPNTSKSLAVMGNTIYIGTSDSELYMAEINPKITDSTPPSATLIAPTTSYTATTANTFAVNATDAASIKKVEFYVGSTMIGYVQSKAANASGCFSIGTSTSCYNEIAEYPGSYSLRWNGKGVQSGSYELKAIAYDIYGNSQSTSSVPITIPEGLYPPDTQAPTISLSSPNSSQRIKKSTVISASATDNEGVVYMEAILDGNVVTTSISGRLYASVPLKKGSHQLVISAKDAAGNTAQTDVYSFSSK